MDKRKILLGTVLVTTFVLAGCQPKVVETNDRDAAMFASPEMVVEEAPVTTEGGVMVGGAIMLPSRTIAVNAADAQNLTTLVSAVQQAGLIETLSGPGPYTVFAPTNAAFEKLPATTWPNLLEPTMNKQLTSLLTYHVVPGNWDSTTLTEGKKLTTVQGEVLTVSLKDDKVILKDTSGNSANIETADVLQSNGVVHVIDAVLVPKKL